MFEPAVVRIGSAGRPVAPRDDVHPQGPELPKPVVPEPRDAGNDRDNCGRLPRRSWLVTKKAERLQEHLHLFLVYPNYLRRRFNRDKEQDTKAKHFGLLPRILQAREALAWRQDWGDLSKHPICTCGSRTVREPFAA